MSTVSALKAMVRERSPATVPKVPGAVAVDLQQEVFAFLGGHGGSVGEVVSGEVVSGEVVSGEVVRW
jgi:hypothetical protein